MTSEEGEAGRVHAAKLPTLLAPDRLRIRPGADGVVATDPVRSGWRYLSFRAFRLADGETRMMPLSNRRYSQRISCDPILDFNLARNECRRLDGRKPKTVDLDLHLRSRRTTDPRLHDVIDIPNFCSSEITYDMWRPNDWIRK